MRGRQRTKQWLSIHFLILLVLGAAVFSWAGNDQKTDSPDSRFTFTVDKTFFVPGFDTIGFVKKMADGRIGVATNIKLDIGLPNMMPPPDRDAALRLLDSGKTLMLIDPVTLENERTFDVEVAASFNFKEMLCKDTSARLSIKMPEIAASKAHLVRVAFQELYRQQHSGLVDSADALIAQGNKEGYIQLLGLLQDQPDIRLTAVAALDKWHWSPSTMDERLAYLLAKDDIAGCAQLGEPAKAILAGMLKNPNMREGALKALSRLATVKSAAPELPVLETTAQNPDAQAKEEFWAAGLDINGRLKALKKIKDRETLIQIIKEYPNEIVGRFAAYQLDSWDEKLAGEWKSDDNLLRIIRLRQAIREVAYLKKIEPIKVTIDAERIGPVDYRNACQAYGEQVSVALDWVEPTDKKPQTISVTWKTFFPQLLSFNASGRSYLPADMPIAELIADLLQKTRCSENELIALATQGKIAELRQAAVEQISIPDLLRRITVEDQMPIVRVAAIKKLMNQESNLEKDKGARLSAGDSRGTVNQEFLSKIAQTDADPAVRMTAGGYLTDQNLAGKIAINDKNPDVSEAAIKVLTDQKLLADIVIAMKDDKNGVIIEALKKISDQQLLARIYHEAHDDFARFMVVETITDQDLLAQIAINDTDESTRRKAVKNLVDQARLAKVIQASQDPAVRAAVAAKLTDQNLLGKITLTDPDKEVRLAAVKNLSDQNVLSQVVIADQSISVRCEAVKNITDQKLLSRVAVDDPDDFVRCDAVVKLTDQNVLAGIALKDPDSWVRRTAAANLKDQTLIAKVAVDAPDDEARAAAVSHLADQNLLAQIAIQDPNPEVRRTAVRKLINKRKLAQIAANDSIKNVRNEARQRLGRPEEK
ncbi:MAG: hypothetical protein HQL23_03630 [Candidatus Omnitrophica bacterium]|nr:hypothetical protein [Candidatus Omnitrophota bacterium]